MPFKPGHPKYEGSGRPKGSLNKFNQDLRERCLDLGKDPFEVLVELMNEPDPIIKLKAATELCGYLYTKKNHIKFEGNMELGQKAEEYKALDKKQKILVLKTALKDLEEAD